MKKVIKIVILIVVSFTFSSCQNSTEKKKCYLVDNDNMIDKSFAHSLLKNYKDEIDFQTEAIVFTGIVLEGTEIFYKIQIQSLESKDIKEEYLIEVGGEKIIAESRFKEVVWEEQREAENKHCIYLSNDIINLEEATNMLRKRLSSIEYTEEYGVMLFKIIENNDELYYQFYTFLNLPDSVRTTGWYAVNVETGEVFRTLPSWELIE